MNQNLGLKILGQIMDWDDERARVEFEWIRLMARLKYDGYRDFQAGMRFVESLATWLQQFDPSDREIAYRFVRKRLVYIGPSEMQRLVEQFFPRMVHDCLTRVVASDQHIPPYRVLTDARCEFDRLQRQTLFMGLSDGARIDVLRQSNAGRLTNEQFVVATQVDTEKWKDLVDNLGEDLQDSCARFRLVYLVDDFAGTGMSFIRCKGENGGKKIWAGKLKRFYESVKAALDRMEGSSIFERDWELRVHYYVASVQAKRFIGKHLKEWQDSLEIEYRPKTIDLSFGTVLPDNIPLDSNDAFKNLTQTYYNPSIETKHTDIGGVRHQGLGFGGCALPLVLEHNTPNNSVALLWAETDGGMQDGKRVHAMRPLFRRRQRHS